MTAHELLTASEALGTEATHMLGRLQDIARKLCEREDALEQEAARVQAEKLKLTEERELFLAECKAVRHINANPTDRIVLDVGGRHFHTTHQTLCAIPDSMLAAMFSGRHAIQTQEDGSVLIDRSPLLFEHVLDFLRSKGSPFLPTDENLQARLQEEFRFYGLPWRQVPRASSVADLFRGNLECRVYKQEHTARVYLGATRLVTCCDGGEFAAVLWDTTTGKSIHSWPMEKRRLGKANGFSLDGSGEYIVGHYQDGDGFTLVVYNSDDATLTRSFVFKNEQLDGCLLIGGESLVVLCGSGTKLSAHDIGSGVLLWERVLDEPISDGPLEFKHSDGMEAFVVKTSKDRYSVFQGRSGRVLYSCTCGSESVESDFWLDGKQLMVIFILRDNLMRSCWFYAWYTSWDETGAVKVPATVLNEVVFDQGAKLQFHGPDTFSVWNPLWLARGDSITHYTLRCPAGGKMAASRGAKLELYSNRELWPDGMRMAACNATGMAALGIGGVVNVWRARVQETGRKRRRVD